MPPWRRSLELLDTGRHRRHTGRGLHQRAVDKLAEIDAKLADPTVIRQALAEVVAAGYDDLTNCASPDCPLPFAELASPPSLPERAPQPTAWRVPRPVAALAIARPPSVATTAGIRHLGARPTRTSCGPQRTDGDKSSGGEPGAHAGLPWERCGRRESTAGATVSHQAKLPEPAADRRIEEAAILLHWAAHRACEQRRSGSRKVNALQARVTS